MMIKQSSCSSINCILMLSTCIFSMSGFPCFVFYSIIKLINIEQWMEKKTI